MLLSLIMLVWLLEFLFNGEKFIQIGPWKLLARLEILGNSDLNIISIALMTREAIARGMLNSKHLSSLILRIKTIPGADAIKKFTPSLGIPYLGV